jgi:DNA-directed RNA polymerase alpha subunit
MITICALSLSLSWAEGEPRPSTTLQFELGPLKLSYLPYRALRHQGLVSLRALLAYTPKTLRLIEGIGAKAVDEITIKLADRGLSYGDSFLGRDVTVTYQQERIKWIEELQQNLLRQDEIGPLLLTEQTARLLRSGPITTLNRLLGWTPLELLALKRFKEINLSEILVRLRERGLMFGDQISGVDIPIEVRPRLPADHPLELVPELVDILAVCKITTLQALLRSDFWRPDWPIDDHYRQQLQVALFERRLKVRQRITGPEIPIIVRPLAKKKAKPTIPEPLRVVENEVQNQQQLGPLIFSFRTYNALQKQNITTLRSLLCLTNKELQVIPNLAFTGLHEIREAIAVRGLEFGQNFTGPDVAIHHIKEPRVAATQPNPQRQNFSGAPIRVNPELFDLLQKKKVLTLKELLKYSRREIFSFVHFDERYFREIEWALAERDVRLGEAYTGPDIALEKFGPDGECADMIEDSR